MPLVLKLDPDAAEDCGSVVATWENSSRPFPCPSVAVMEERAAAETMTCCQACQSHRPAVDVCQPQSHGSQHQQLIGSHTHTHESACFSLVFIFTLVFSEEVKRFNMNSQIQGLLEPAL